VRLPYICTVGSVVCLGLGLFASNALADSGPGSVAGGATAPAATGPTGTTGTTGSSGAIGTTGASGTTGTSGPGDDATPQLIPTKPGSALAPIILPKGQSVNYVYPGPVFVQTADGSIVPYAPQTQIAAVAGGALAGTAPTSGLAQLLVPGDTAEIVNGIAAAPENAPQAVQEAIWATNTIIGRPYLFGGGHRSFHSSGYDCSGTVSFALHGARLLSSPLDSGQFMSWGRAGQGHWMSILTNPGHAYLDIAGLRLDTSTNGDPSNKQGPRWRPLLASNSGFVVRHPTGF
jgi:cell wall-associated NlpC family hydrolase